MHEVIRCYVFRGFKGTAPTIDSKFYIDNGHWVVIIDKVSPRGILPVPWHVGHVTLSRPVNST